MTKGVSRAGHESLVRSLGLAATAIYAAFIGWLFTVQPRTIAEVTGGLAASVGAYSIDARQFADGLRFFRRERYPEARAAFERADPAHRDARTQFYIAYSYYREGWGRLYHDDRLYRLGIEAVDRAIALAPDGRLVVDDDPDLGLPSADELKAELEAGTRREADDFNPLRVLRSRK